MDAFDFLQKKLIRIPYQSVAYLYCVHETECLAINFCSECVCTYFKFLHWMSVVWLASTTDIHSLRTVSFHIAFRWSDNTVASISCTWGYLGRVKYTDVNAGILSSSRRWCLFASNRIFFVIMHTYRAHKYRVCFQIIIRIHFSYHRATSSVYWKLVESIARICQLVKSCIFTIVWLVQLINFAREALFPRGSRAISA